MSTTAKESKPAKTGRNVLIGGAIAIAVLALVAAIIDNASAVANAIFISVTWGHFWIGAAVHTAATLVMIYAVCKLGEAKIRKTPFAVLLCIASPIYIASTCAVLDIWQRTESLTVYQGTFIAALLLGALCWVAYTATEIFGPPGGR